MKYLSCFCVVLGLSIGLSCKVGEPNDGGETGTETGDGDGDTTGDGDGDGDGDNGDGDGHCCGEAADQHTIYEIQDGSISPFGWVFVSKVGVTAKRSNGLWVQELNGGPYSGIWVYVGENSPNLEAIEIGDLVDVLGVRGQFNEVTEINALNGSVTVVGSLETPLPPDVITVGDIDATWESVFVRVEGELEVVGLPGAGELIINDGNATSYVDDYVFNVVDADGEFPDLGLEATFTAIQGPLNFSASTFKVIPRSAADLEGYQPFPW